MANTVIQLKHSTLTGNVPSSLANGEISINSRDGKFFYSTPAGVVTTHYPYLGPAGLNKEIQFNDSGTLGANAGLSFDKSSGIFSTKLISVTNSTGDEGGEILLAKPSTNTTLVGTGITIDAFQNKIRFFEQGGSARGAYIDLTECVGGAGTNLLNPTSTPDTTARNTANAAFIQANAAFTAANSAGVYANGAFAAANAATATDLTQNNSIAAAFAAANSAGSYANSAFIVANNSLLIDTTQNNSIAAAFTAANSAGVYANGAFAAANTDFTGVTITAANYGTASAVASFRVEANGRISSANNTAIAIDTSAITSGTLGVARGGTGAGSFTTNGVLLGQGTSALTTASSSTEGHVLTINASGVPTFAHLQGGTF